MKTIARRAAWIVSCLLLLAGLIGILWVVNSIATAVWLSAHPNENNALWAQRAVHLLYVLGGLIAIEVIGVVLVARKLMAVNRKQRRERSGLDDRGRTRQ